MARTAIRRPVGAPKTPNPVWVPTLKMRWEDKYPVLSSPLQITSSPNNCRSGNSAMVDGRQRVRVRDQRHDWSLGIHRDDRRGNVSGLRSRGSIRHRAERGPIVFARRWRSPNEIFPPRRISRTVMRRFTRTSSAATDHGSGDRRTQYALALYVSCTYINLRPPKTGDMLHWGVIGTDPLFLSVRGMNLIGTRS
jgi:hypothetical protein